MSVHRIPKYEYTDVIVLDILDADTMKLLCATQFDMGFGVSISGAFTGKFRIVDYDAPETYRPRSQAEAEHGARATAFAHELLTECGGRVAVVRTFKAAPSIYGRYEAELLIKSPRYRDPLVSFAEVMIEHGFAKLTREEYAKIDEERGAQ